MSERTVTLLVPKHYETVYFALAAMQTSQNKTWFHLDEVAEFLRDKHARYALSSSPNADKEFALTPLDMFPAGWSNDLIVASLKGLTSRGMLQHRTTDRGNEVAFLPQDQHKMFSVRNPERTQQVMAAYAM